MEINQTGIILYTVNYLDCIKFYNHIMGLEILYKKESLTCFDFLGSYLMIEIDDEFNKTETLAPVRDRLCLRMNVPDVKEACKALDKHNIPYSYGEYEWGIIAKFRDPDGNLLGFRSAKEHQEDIEIYE
ncbi:MAG: glyoxalase/bleomycin resistance/dioxygenase family protein [Saprospiraceae bacterium]|nr:glyoxalase/bleomycin resistance/dioxygenase family protein [Saprospiraceae bacterium]